VRRHKGTTGTVRANASLDWIGQDASPWGDTLANGTDYMHIDCNGDSIINADDTLAIVLNYGKVHLKTSNTTAGAPVLYVEFPTDSVVAGAAVSVSIFLGTSASPANNVYGLAFSIHYDPALIDTGSVRTNFTTSWLGTIGTDMITLTKDLYFSGQVDIGMTRIDHTNVSGFGQIGELNFVMQDDLAGIIAKTLQLTFSNVIVISNDESIIPVGTGGDSLVVVGIDDAQYLLEKHIKVYPNPASRTVHISLNNIKAEKIRLMNVLGEILYVARNVDSKLQINVEDHPQGIYLLNIITNQGVVNRRLVIH